MATMPANRQGHGVPQSIGNAILAGCAEFGPHSYLEDAFAVFG